MSSNKTRKTSQSAREYVQTVGDPQKRKDCLALMSIMHRVTGKRAAMWGTSIIGYGRYHYKYESGREGDFFMTGFAPRAQNITIYIIPGFSDYASLMSKLGKHKLGKSCLYIKRLTDVDADVLTQLIELSVDEVRQRYVTD